MGSEIDPKLKARMRSMMRSEWRKDRERRAVMVDARVSRGLYMCAICKTLHGPKKVDIDHIEPVTPITGYIDLETEANRLFVKKDKMRCLCKPCHKDVSAGQATARAEFRAGEKEKSADSAVKVLKKTKKKKLKRIRK